MRKARCTHYDGGAKTDMKRESSCRAKDGPCKCELLSSPSLAFFEDKSPGHTNEECKDCRYREIAHIRHAEGRAKHLEGRICHQFSPRIEGHEYDRFYCGCWGWD